MSLQLSNLEFFKQMYFITKQRMVDLKPKHDAYIESLKTGARIEYKNGEFASKLYELSERTYGVCREYLLMYGAIS